MDTDQEEIRYDSRKLKKQYYASLFRKYDEDGSGFIELKELKIMLLKDENVSKKIVKKVFKVSDKNEDGKIDIDEFIDMVHNKNFSVIFGDYVNAYVRYLLPRQEKFELLGNCSCTDISQETKSTVLHFLKDFFKNHRLPIAMPLITILQITSYFLPKLSFIFIYNPNKRYEVWRYLTYMFVHVGHLHLMVNLIVQIMLGMPLEIANGYWRVSTVYLTGVIMGSLLTSISDPTVFLAGASGGVYSLITAHVASVLMNWNEMSFAKKCQLFAFLFLTIIDVGTSIYNYHFLEVKDHIGSSAHLGGALTGLLVGIWVLKNFEVTTHEKYIWWIAFVLFVILSGGLVVLNIFWTSHFTPSL